MARYLIWLFYFCSQFIVSEHWMKMIIENCKMIDDQMDLCGVERAD
jgi:hypothetical protein